MFDFLFEDKSIHIDIDGCFEPNLTTKIMLSCAIKELNLKKISSKRLLELGCGSGVITTYLLKYGFLRSVNSVGMSDISPRAVATAESNINLHLIEKSAPTFEFRVGSGMQIWTDFECDVVINDISAISEAIVPMNQWFSNAPNNAGLDGIANSIQVLEEFASIPSKDTVMLMPVLTLSNVKKLEYQINKLNLSFEKLIKKAWPLPGEMVERYYDELEDLRSAGYINFTEKFGQLVVETSCYKIRKGE